MEIKVFNQAIELKGIIDTFTSLRWTRKYFTTGEFELHTPITMQTLELLRKDNIVYKDDNEAGFIEFRELSIGEDGEELLVCKGKLLTAYLGRRINWDKLIQSNTAENIMRNLVNINAVDTANKDRKIEYLELGEFNNFTEKIDYQNSYGNLLECLEFISNTTNLGFRIDFDCYNKKLKFEVYKGINRSTNQNNNAPCIFSRELENILEQKFTESINNYKNTVLIAGAGEDDNRKKTSLEKGKGINRFELFVDARDLSDKEEINNEEIEIPWDRYKALLLQRANEKLQEYKEVVTFDSSINLKSNVYKQDFDLGDIITVFDPYWGITLDTRITEVEEIYENEDFELNVVFGNNIPTLVDKIKARLR